MTVDEVRQRITPGREIDGISAVLLPFNDSGRMDLEGLAANLQRTAVAGLKPAVNMDTGYTNLLTGAQRREVLRTTQDVLGDARFVAGAYIEGEAGSPRERYGAAVAAIQEHGGTPILFQCSELKEMAMADIVRLYTAVAAECQELLAFELGAMFAPFGHIFELELVEQLMQIPQLKGIKHSSLNRQLEWQRLELRDRIRPDFKIYTGNDLAIDMVMYGSDYLLGLSALCPEAFGLRDRLWQQGDAAFYALNDLLQYLGCFAFRAPVPAYKHSAAQFLRVRGRIECDEPPPGAARRPDADLEVLRGISHQLDVLLDS